MALASSLEHDDPPVIWLLPPSALLPPPHPIRPIPIATSVTLATLIILGLIILFNRKPKAITPARENVDLAVLKDSIRVIRSASAAPAVSTPPPHSLPQRSPTPSQAEDESSGSNEPQVMTYHDALKDIRNASYQPSSVSPRSPSIDSYYSPPNTTTNDEPMYKTHADHHRDTAVSSNYSYSIGPTPLPSRQNSLRNRDVNGVWTRLRLGSEYDGDRTSVPSETNLQLGKAEAKQCRTS